MKSHVGLGYHVCPVCCKEHDEVVLIDKRLIKSLEHRQPIEWKMCDEHQKMLDEGYVALIECENRPTGLNDAQRTGAIVHIRGEAWTKIFDVPKPPKGLAFVEKGMVQKLQKMTEEAPPSGDSE